MSNRDEHTQERDAALLHVGKLNNEVNAARAQLAMLIEAIDTPHDSGCACAHDHLCSHWKAMSEAFMRANNATWLEQHDAQVTKMAYERGCRDQLHVSHEYMVGEYQDKVRREAAEENR